MDRETLVALKHTEIAVSMIHWANPLCGERKKRALFFFFLVRIVPEYLPRVGILHSRQLSPWGAPQPRAIRSQRGFCGWLKVPARWGPEKQGMANVLPPSFCIEEGISPTYAIKQSKKDVRGYLTSCNLVFLGVSPSWMLVRLQLQWMWTLAWFSISVGGKSLKSLK